MNLGCRQLCVIDFLGNLVMGIATSDPASDVRYQVTFQDMSMHGTVGINSLDLHPAWGCMMINGSEAKITRWSFDIHLDSICCEIDRAARKRKVVIVIPVNRSTKRATIQALPIDYSLKHHWPSLGPHLHCCCHHQTKVAIRGRLYSTGGNIAVSQERRSVNVLRSARHQLTAIDRLGRNDAIQALMQSQYADSISTQKYTAICVIALLWNCVSE